MVGPVLVRNAAPAGFLTAAAAGGGSDRLISSACETPAVTGALIASAIHTAGSPPADLPRSAFAIPARSVGDECPLVGGGLAVILSTSSSRLVRWV